MMIRRLIAPSIALFLIGLFTYTVPFNPRASASPQEITVISRTRGGEVLTAEVISNDVRIKLKNNHNDTITAFAIKLSNTTIKEDFAFSEVHFGIEPGDTFEKSYPLSPSPNREPPTLHLLTILLKCGTRDGNSKVAQEIEDVRLGQKIQILRTIRILEKQGQSGNDLKTIKSDMEAALNADEFEIRTIVKELQPTRTDSKLSDNLKNGLQWGRETMLRKLEEVEQQRFEYREHAFKRLQARLPKMFAKL